LADAAKQTSKLEITRLASSNVVCYPDAEGATGTFSSTELYLITMLLPELRLLSRPANGVVFLEVVAEPDKTIVLQGSNDLKEWSNVDTNSAPSGTNMFTVSVGEQVRRFFRAAMR